MLEFFKIPDVAPHNELRYGETIVLYKQNVAIAKIHLIPKPDIKSRPIGLAKGEFKVTDSFFDPLTDDFV